MSEPRDLGFEQLGDRHGRRPVRLPEIAHVFYLADSSHTRLSQGAYAMLIDAVFTAPGAAEWLSRLRKAVAAKRAAKE